MYLSLCIMTRMTNLCQLNLKYRMIARTAHLFFRPCLTNHDIVIGTDHGRLSGTTRQQIIGRPKLPSSRFQCAQHSLQHLFGQRLESVLHGQPLPGSSSKIAGCVSARFRMLSCHRTCNWKIMMVSLLLLKPHPIFSAR